MLKFSYSGRDTEHVAQAALNSALARLKTAQYFMKRETVVSSSTALRNPFSYVPCQATDPGAKKMTLDQVPTGKLGVRPVGKVSYVILNT